MAATTIPTPLPRLEAVISCGRDGVMGIDGRLAWRDPRDMRRFAELTRGHVVIMGRKTWDSLPVSPLPGRKNVVVTSRVPDIAECTTSLSAPDVHFCSLEDLGAVLHGIAGAGESPTLFVIGGAQLLTVLLPHISTIHLTHIDATLEPSPTPTPSPSPTTPVASSPSPPAAPPSITRLQHLEGFAIRNVQPVTREFSFVTLQRVASPSPSPYHGLLRDDPCPFRDDPYHGLLREVLECGRPRGDRTGTGTLSLFGRQLRFDLRDGAVPAVTTKRLAWKSCLRELLWFLRGSTDSAELEKRGVGIWRGNSSRRFLDARGLGDMPEGDIGAGYGFQWRHFGAEYGTCRDAYEGCGEDQIEQLVRGIREDPFSRRHVVSAWNPAALHRMALPPCHVLFQFYVHEEEEAGESVAGDSEVEKLGTRRLMEAPRYSRPRVGAQRRGAQGPRAQRRGLSCHMYQRSVDCFLGLPFNIFSYAMLTHLIAARTGTEPHELVISTGDTHVYSNHVAQVREQLSRRPFPSPKIWLDPRLATMDWSEMDVNEHFRLYGYMHHPALGGAMAV